MTINGREVRFRRTVKTNCLLAEQSPNKDITRYSELWTDASFSDGQLAAAFFIFAMSDGYESWRSFKESGYVPQPISVEELMTLDESEFSALLGEAISAYNSDGKITVQTQPKRSKKKVTPQAQKSE